MKAEDIDPAFFVANNGYGLRQSLLPLLVYFVLLALAAIAQGYILIALAILIGLTQYRLYFPLHEASHFHLFTSRSANRTVGRLLAALLFTSFNAFRREHVQHHGTLGTGQDPGNPDYGMNFSSRRALVMFLLQPLVGGTVFTKVRNLFSYRGGSSGTKDYVDFALTAFVQLFLFLAVSRFGAELWRYPVLVMLPFVTLFLFLSRLRMFLEHAPMALEIVVTRETVVSRTVSDARWDTLLLSGCNFRYHHEHHRFPQIPGVHLPRLSGVLSEKFGPHPSREASYAGLLHGYWKRLG